MNGIQRADLSQNVDGIETLGKRLDLYGYQYIYVVYSENVNEINPNAKRNDTTYSLIGMKNDLCLEIIKELKERRRKIC